VATGAWLASAARNLHRERQLDFTLPDSTGRYQQQVFIATGSQSDAARRRQLEREGREVVIAGAGAYVEGRPLVDALAQKGFRSAFLLAGPRMLETMLRDAVLSRLYVTVTHRLLGGESFHSMIEGAQLQAAGRLKLATLYLDSASSNGTGQFLRPVRAAAPHRCASVVAPDLDRAAATFTRKAGGPLFDESGISLPRTRR